MLILRFMESLIKATFCGVKKTVLLEERYQNVALIFLPVQSHCEVFAEGSILQCFEPDSAGAKFHEIAPFP